MLGRPPSLVDDTEADEEEEHLRALGYLEEPTSRSEAISIPVAAAPRDVCAAPRGTQRSQGPSALASPIRTA
jgi:hypothetical protein